MNAVTSSTKRHRDIDAWPLYAPLLQRGGATRRDREGKSEEYGQSKPSTGTPSDHRLAGRYYWYLTFAPPAPLLESDMRFIAIRAG